MNNINAEEHIINFIKEIEQKILSKDTSAEDLGKSSFLLQFMLNNFSRRNKTSEINTSLQALVNKIEKRQKSILHS